MNNIMNDTNDKRSFALHEQSWGNSFAKKQTSVLSHCAEITMEVERKYNDGPEIPVFFKITALLSENQSYWQN